MRTIKGVPNWNDTNAPWTPRLRTATLCGPILLFAISSCTTVIGQQCVPSVTQQFTKMDGSSTKRVGARAAVESLANRNHAPDLVGDDHVPLFDPNFDWAENERVWKSVSDLTKNVEDEWHKLVEHLDDHRYCITLKDIEGSTRNWTVGDICDEIVGRSLAAAYHRHLRPLTVIVEVRLRTPELPPNPKKWCRQQGEKQLYELQIDMCDWAIKKLTQFAKEPDELRSVSPTTMRRWIEAIRTERESLRAHKTAVHYAGFRGESQRPYGRDEADKVRMKHKEKGRQKTG